MDLGTASKLSVLVEEGDVMEDRETEFISF
jgi:hypothetical protein